MALPLSTPGSCCGHTLNFHDRVRINGVAVRPCLACDCRNFVAEGSLQCRAELHGQVDGNLRCQAEVGGHDGDHWTAVGEYGNKVHWTESVAVYPEPTMTEAIDAALSARESQIGGNHYAQHRIQVWDIAVEYNLSYIEGSALKYLLRRKDNRLEDLKKARHCLDRLIELEGGE